MTNKKKLFLLDAYALIYRSFFAFIKNPRINSKGLDTSAIFGFTNTLIEVLKKENPSHIAVVFDRSGPTFRHKEFPEYKANREPTPDGIIESKPYIDRLLNAMNITKLYLDGYEADDVIGTIAKKAEKDNFQVYMMTPDKDFSQLVSENIFMYKPSNKWGPSEILGIKEILEKFQIEKISQVIDFLGMMGDSVDNIPGLPGVGKKTAQKFIKEYGSMENLIANTHKLKGKLREKIEKNKNQGLLSKKLATISTNSPIDFKKEDLKLKGFDIQKIKLLFEELEFKTLSKRVLDFSITPSKKEKKTISKQKDLPNNEGQLDMFASSSKEKEKSSPHIKKYSLIKTNKELINLYEKIQSVNKFSFHIISNINSDLNNISSIAFSYNPHESIYCTLSEENIPTIKKMFQNSSILKIGFNVKENLKLLMKYNINNIDNLFDVEIAHYLLHPDMRHDIHLLSENFLSYEMEDLNSILGKGKNKKSLSDLSESKKISYCCENADIALQLSELFSVKLTENNSLNLFNNIEMPLISVLTKMEMEGINLNLNMLSKFSLDLDQEISSIEKEIWKISNEGFNISSPKQLGEILFEKMKISSNIKKTKSGQYSTSEETLSKLRKSHPIIDKILEYRSLQKLQSTYVTNLPLLVNKHTKRIHTTFNQSVASTGRLSSINPNLQNIPIRTEKGRKMRMAFIPKNNDYEILCADYSQIELRIMASLSKDESMLKAFDLGEDIHLATASKVYNLPEKKITKEMRSNAKMVNFGIIYGISPFGLSQKLKIKRTEAANIINQYFTEFPKIKDYIQKTILKAQETEYVETIFGRRRYLKDINSRNAMLRKFAERNAINAPIQGSAADIIKKAMINIQYRIEKEKLESKMLLQVHDELIFDMKKSESKILRKIVKEEMEKKTKISIPLLVDIESGNNWLEAH